MAKKQNNNNHSPEVETTEEATTMEESIGEETNTTEETEEEAPEAKPVKGKTKELRKVPFCDPLPKVLNTDTVKVKILRDFNKHKAGQEKTVTGFLAKQLVYKKVAKVI